MTSSIVDWIEVFNADRYFMIMIDALRFYQEKNNLQIYAYVIMKDHFHIIASNKYLSRLMQSYKRYTAHKIVDILNKDNQDKILTQLRLNKPDYKTTSIHQVWQEGLHPKEIQSLDMLNQKIGYNHENPVRKKYVERAIDWKYSSAVDYLSEMKGLIDIYKTR